MPLTTVTVRRPMRQAIRGGGPCSCRCLVIYMSSASLVLLVREPGDSRRLGDERGAGESVRARAGARWERAPARPRLARRRALARGPPARRCSSSRGRSGWGSGRGCTRSRTAATCRRPRPSRISTRCLPGGWRRYGPLHAMDRDGRWDRTEAGVAGDHRVAVEGMSPPTSLQRSSGRCNGTMRGSHRRVHRAIVLNGRPRLGPRTPRSSSTSVPDRARQLSSEAARRGGIDLTTMTRYRDDFDCPAAFPDQDVHETMAEVLAEPGCGSSTPPRPRSTRT